MKRILLTTVSLGVLGFAAPALAADLPMYAKAPAIAAPAYDWSGFYVGVFGGDGYGNHNLNNALGPAGFANFTVNYSSHRRARWRRGRIQRAERQLRVRCRR